MTSLKTEIAQAIELVIGGISDIKTVSYKEIKLLASDFQEFELPRIQIIDMDEISVHENGRAVKTWNLSLELVIGPTGLVTPTQDTLWDLMQTIEEKLFADPKLGKNYILQMMLLGSSTDLHILRPYFTSRIDIQIIYYQPLVSSC